MRKGKEWHRERVTGIRIETSEYLRADKKVVTDRLNLNEVLLLLEDTRNHCNARYVSMNLLQLVTIHG
tara:strand:+ start:1165 stop:1368 length:204 start_codon:yes stop_codon:yes gene_type:complete